MNRIYPKFVNRNIAVPDWAKIPFVPKGMPPVMIFTIGAAKGIARTRWRREHGDRVPSEEEIKQFVFTFLARWRGDEAHRYAVLARWAYEFLRDAKKDRERRRKSTPGRDGSTRHRIVTRARRDASEAGFGCGR
jgi:hypothetical protein